MKTQWTAILFATTLAALAPSPAASAERPAPADLRALVLDEGSRTLSLVDPLAARVLSSVPLEGAPEGIQALADRSRVFAWDFGERKLTMRFGWHPKEQSTVTVIDPSGPAVVARTKVCWNLTRIVATADLTRLTAVCTGYQSQKPAETLPREVVSLDARTGEVKGRLAVERAFGVALLTSDSDVAVLYSPPERPKNAPAVPAELRLVDVRGPSLLATIKVEGDPDEALFSPDRAHVYLLEKGRRDKKPEKTIRARLQVHSVEARGHVANLDVGVEARDTILDEERGLLYVLSDGQPSPEDRKPRGTLHVVRGEDVVASVPIGPLPLFVRQARDRGRMYVVSARTLTVVDTAAWRVTAEMPLEAASGGLGEVAMGYAWDAPDHSPSDLGVTRDGRRGFVLYNTSSKLLVLDLEGSRTVASVATGRGGKKFAKFLGAATLSALATAGSRMTYAPPPRSGYMVLVSTDLALRPDGRFAYANNSQSNDVTVVDAETAAVVDKIPAGGKELMTFHGERTLAVVDDTSLHLIDMETNRKTGEVEFGTRLRRLDVAPDGSRALALTDGAVHVLDGASGKVLNRVTPFQSPTQVVFLAPAAAPAAGPTDEAAEPAAGRAEPAGEAAEEPPGGAGTDEPAPQLAPGDTGGEEAPPPHEGVAGAVGAMHPHCDVALP